MVHYLRGGGKIQFIPNGIELSRVLNKRKPRISDDKFIFLAFGGRNSQKDRCVAGSRKRINKVKE